MPKGVYPSHGNHPPELIEEIRSLAEEHGLSAGRIAAHLDIGLTRNAVIGICLRNKIRLPGSLGHGSSKGQTRKHGSYAPKVTLSKPFVPKSRKERHFSASLHGLRSMDRVMTGPQAEAFQTVREVLGEPTSEEAHTLAESFPERNAETALTIFALSGSCRYPIGETPPFQECSRERRIGSPYCLAHHALCYRSAREERRSAPVATRTKITGTWR